MQGEGGGVRCRLRLRLPPWANSNGVPPSARLSSGAALPVNSGPAGPMLEVDRSAWRASESLQLDLPMALRTEALPDTRPPYRSLHALLAGPLLLAGLTHGPRVIVARPDDPTSWLRPVPPSAAAQLRTLIALPSTNGAAGGSGGSGYVSAGPRGVSRIGGAPPSGSRARRC